MNEIFDNIEKLQLEKEKFITETLLSQPELSYNDLNELFFLMLISKLELENKELKQEINQIKNERSNQ